MNLKNSCLISFGEISQTLLGYKTQKSGNKNPTNYWGINSNRPLFAVDSRTLPAVNDSQTKIELATSGTGGKPELVTQAQLDTAVKAITSQDKFSTFDIYFITIGLAGGTQAYSYTLAAELKKAGKKVIFLVVDLTESDFGREANSSFGKSKLANYSHCFIADCISWSEESKPFEVQFMDSLKEKLDLFDQLFSQDALDSSDVDNLIANSSSFFLLRCDNWSGQKLASHIKKWLSKQKTSKIGSLGFQANGFSARLEAHRLKSELALQLDDQTFYSPKTGQGESSIIIFGSTI
jgi:hypothetical protein